MAQKDLSSVYIWATPAVKISEILRNLNPIDVLEQITSRPSKEITIHNYCRINGGYKCDLSKIDILPFLSHSYYGTIEDCEDCEKLLEMLVLEKENVGIPLEINFDILYKIRKYESFRKLKYLRKRHSYLTTNFLYAYCGCFHMLEAEKDQKKKTCEKYIVTDPSFEQENIMIREFIEKNHVNTFLHNIYCKTCQNKNTSLFRFVKNPLFDFNLLTFIRLF